MAITDRLRPLDLQAYIDANGDMLLSAAIAQMQGTGAAPKTFVCPKCANKGIITLANPAGMKVPCDICLGYAKTDTQMISDPANPGSYMPFLDITGPDTVAVGNTITLANTTAGGIWNSNHTDNATIDPGTGVVTGKLAGSTTITYTFNGSAKTKVITVE